MLFFFFNGLKSIELRGWSVKYEIFLAEHTRLSYHMDKDEILAETQLDKKIDPTSYTHISTQAEEGGPGNFILTIRKF